MTETTTEPTVEDVAQRLAEMEALAIRTGAKVQIDPPEFAGEKVGAPFTIGSSWQPFWFDAEHPTMARATVHRDGVPTIVYVSWEESAPADEQWRALWERRPMKLFGAYALRAALRRAFRDVIGEQREPDEKPAPGEPSAERVPIDWNLAIFSAMTVVDLDAVWENMRRDRARTGALEKAYKDRRAALAAPAWEPAPVNPAAGKIDGIPATDLSPEEAVKDRAFDFDVYPPVSARDRAYGATPRMPQDHQPPQNRAARRANRKGRR